MPIIAMPAAPIRVEPAPIKGSRFYGLLSPVQTEEDVKAHLQQVREELPGATHYCWAYCFEDGRAIANDDGEPTNSAGPPILRHIHGSGLVNVHIVVVRYFGGTKLGVGGLIRAYGDVAKAAYHFDGLVSARLLRSQEEPYDRCSAKGRPNGRTCTACTNRQPP